MVYVKIFKSSFTQIDTIRSIGNIYTGYPRYRDFNEYFVDTFLTFKPIKEFEIRLPFADDYRNHNTEYAMPGLPAGNYVIFFSNNPKFIYKNNAVVYQFITASNISFINRRNSSGEAEYYVLNRKTGKPIENARADAYVNNYNYRIREYISMKWGSYVTDNNGYFKIWLK